MWHTPRELIAEAVLDYVEQHQAHGYPVDVHLVESDERCAGAIFGVPVKLRPEILLLATCEAGDEKVTWWLCVTGGQIAHPFVRGTYAPGEREALGNHAANREWSDPTPRQRRHSDAEAAEDERRALRLPSPE